MRFVNENHMCSTAKLAYVHLHLRYNVFAKPHNFALSMHIELNLHIYCTWHNVDGNRDLHRIMLNARINNSNSCLQCMPNVWMGRLGAVILHCYLQWAWSGAGFFVSQ